MKTIVVKKIYRTDDLAWIRIPKVASSAMYDFFEKHNVFHKPMTGISIEEFLALPRPGFVFAFVRNPFDRLVSAYYNRACRGLSSKEFNAAAAAGDFDGYIRSVCNTEDKHLEQHMRPQTLFLEGFEPDFVGRYETFQKDWKTVCQNIGFTPKSLPKKNVTNNRPPDKQLWTKELMGLVQERFKADFKRFGYKLR